MHILPISTPLLRAGDDLAAMLRMHGDIRADDILVVSSKAVATCEGTIHHLAAITVSRDAERYATLTGRSPAFCQVVIDEIARLKGTVLGHCPGAILAQLFPQGMESGSILAPNAGMDESNMEPGTAAGWPLDPVVSAETLHAALGAAIIITDSCCIPRRWGVTAYALAVAGFDPLKSEIGKEDLFGRKLRVTKEATADQLAVAGNFVMGNAGQSTPSAIMRDHGVELSHWSGWVPGISPAEDLFSGILK